MMVYYYVILYIKYNTYFVYCYVIIQIKHTRLNMLTGVPARGREEEEKYKKKTKSEKQNERLQFLHLPAGVRSKEKQQHVSTLVS